MTAQEQLNAVVAKLVNEGTEITSGKVAANLGKQKLNGRESRWLREARESLDLSNEPEAEPEPTADDILEVMAEPAQKSVSRRRPTVQIRDTQTGAVYRSKYAAGVALAPEAGLDGRVDKWVITRLIRRWPGRLEEIRSATE